MYNYQSVVADILATQFVSPVVTAADEEAGKAQLLFAAVWQIHQTNPNIGLVEKTSGNAIDGMTVDVMMDKTDGSAADCSSSTPDAPGYVRITTPWSPYAANMDPAWLTRWRAPTQTLATKPTPMQRTGTTPPPDPTPPPADNSEVLAAIAALRDDMQSGFLSLSDQLTSVATSIMSNDNANTEKIQTQIHGVVEDMEDSLKKAAPFLLKLFREADDDNSGGIGRGQ